MTRWRTPAIVFAVAVALRVAIVFQLQGTALFRTPELDSIEYYNWAHAIASGDFSWPASPSHGPGYPFFLALLLFVTRGSMFAVHILQAVMGGVTAALIAIIASRLDERAALPAGLFAALYGPLALTDVSILAEGLFILLLTASLVVRSRFAVGTLLGLAIITRPTAAILVALYAYYFWRQRAARRELAMFAIGVLWPIVPVLIAGHQFAIQSGGGMNFYIGNSPLHDGTAWARPGGGWDWLRGEAWRAGVRGSSAEDHYYLTHTFDEMHSATGHWLLLVVRKIVWLTQTEEIRDSHSYDFFLLRAPLLRGMIRFSVLLPFALFGIWCARKHAETPLLVAYALAMSITVIFLVVGMRYRLPMLPPLFVFAGAGLAAVAERKLWVSFAAMFIVVFALTHFWRHAPTHNLAEEWAMEGIASSKEHQTAKALSAFGFSIRNDPYIGIAWSGRGDVELPQRRFNEAERDYSEAIAVDPHYARAYAHLALLRDAQGDRNAAIELLRESIAIRPENEAMYNLSGLLFAAGDLDGCEQILRDMLTIDPHDAEAAAGLASVAAARRSRH